MRPHRRLRFGQSSTNTGNEDCLCARALRDVDEILAYVQKRRPSGARNLSVAIERAIERCAFNPHIGGKTAQPHLYRWPLRRYRYTIFYGVLLDADTVEIARVVHAARVKNLRRMPRID